MPTFFARRFSLGTLLRVGIICALVGAIALYATFQARHIIEGPVVVLTEPPFESAAATVVLSGTARNITSLSLNDRPIYTDDEGHFNELVALPIGYTILTLRAEDRYGRVKIVEHAHVRTQGDIIPQS